MTDLTANLLEAVFRWLHVLSGVLWLGTLYFFAWIGGECLREADLDVTDRALYWARWGAAFNWLSGLLLLGLTYYHTRIVPLGGPAALALLLTFGGVGIYEIGARLTRGMGRLQLASGWLFFSLAGVALERLGLPYRAYAIHLGVLMGSVMAFNVWFRIWPAQRLLLASARAGAPPDPACTALATDRAKHNAYLSVPLLFLMVSQHASTAIFAAHPFQPLVLSLVVLTGFGLTRLLEAISRPAAAR